jgi:hypothetical protein
MADVFAACGQAVFGSGGQRWLVFWLCKAFLATAAGDDLWGQHVESLNEMAMFQVF